MFRIKSFIILLLSCAVLPSFAQSPMVKKAGQSVFTLTTYNPDGTIHATSHGVFTGGAGEAVAMWHLFKDASRAVIIDTKGKQYDIDAMLGVSENYDLCKFRVKNFTNSAVNLPLVKADAPATSVYIVDYDLKKPNIKKVSPERSEKFMTTNNYYVFRDEDVSGSELGCPIVNDNGELLGIMQRPEDGGQAYSADARLITSLTRSGFSLNDPTFRATGIRPALPEDESQAILMLMMASTQVDSAKYEAYVDDFIKFFPTATDGYNARANRLFAKRDLAGADEMLQTEVKKAAKKDVAYSNYAAIVYQACIYRVDTTFTKWTLDRAMDLAKEADKVNPQPNYQHQQAQILYAQKKYQQALDILTALQKTDLGKNGEVYYEAAQCKSQLKAPKAEIMTLLDSAVNAQKGNVSAPYVLARGQEYDNNGEYRKAFLDYMTYDSLMNYNATAEFYYTKYRCEMKIRQYQIALNDIAHAIVLNRTEPVYYAEMASLQLRVNQPENAIKTCDLALQLQGADQISDLYIIKGIALCETKQKEEGLAALQKAQELGDNRAEELIKKYSK